MATSMLSPVKPEIDYPESDGQPVAETDVHISALLYARAVLHHHFRRHPDVYVAGNLLIYYREGDIRARVAPDVFVVKGVPNRDRTSYLLWKEGKAPHFVLEITSRGTREEDQGRKRELYRRLAVREYWQYDPTEDWLKPPLRGMELRAGDYVELPSSELADGTRVMASTALGLELRLGAGGLRFHDALRGQTLGTFAETDEARERAEAARERAEVAREHAEAAREHAEAAREQEETRRRTAEEAHRAAEARVAELEALLRRERGLS